MVAAAAQLGAKVSLAGSSASTAGGTTSNMEVHFLEISFRWIEQIWSPKTRTSRVSTVFLSSPSQIDHGFGFVTNPGIEDNSSS